MTSALDSPMDVRTTLTPRIRGFGQSPADQPASGGHHAATALVAVVGVDGSAASWRALDAAVQLIHGRPGQLEIIWVAHEPATMAMAPGRGYAVVRTAFDDEEQQLREQVHARVGAVEPRYRFQRCEGAPAHELIRVAEARRDQDDAPTVVLVVGGSAHRHNHVGSVACSVVRHGGRALPIFMVP